MSHTERPASAARVDRARQARLRLLAAMGDGAGSSELLETELLRLALQQAVAELSGLGGMVHLGDGREPMLRLAVTAGLPRPLVRPWDEIGRDEQVAPARAVRERSFVWLPSAESGAAPGWTMPSAPYPPGTDRSGTERPRPTIPDTTGLAAVPLSDERGPLGVLSVFTLSPGPPPAREREFLHALAERGAQPLHASAPTGPPVHPAWWQEPSGTRREKLMTAAEVGSWEWNIRTGEMLADDALLEIGGLSRETFDGRVESWLNLIHPDDLPSLLAEVNRARARGKVPGVEYRLRRPDGSVRWAEARGQILPGEDGEPERFMGMTWDTTASRTSQDSIRRALRYMSDGFFAVDSDWRVTYLNRAAEDLLGPADEVIGKAAWDVLPEIEELGLTDVFRKAMGSKTPTDLQRVSPRTQRWYHVRLIPLPGGLMVFFADIHDLRMQQEERVRAKASAERRAARVEELTAALAQALTVDDVVRAVADRVLPPFGASGLVIQTSEDERLRVVGSSGYPAAFLDRLHGMPIKQNSPVRDVFLTRAPLFIDSPEEFTRRYPDAVEYVATGDKKSWAFIPLIASGHPVGYYCISFDNPRVLVEDERTLLIALSGLVAQALERARLYDTEHERAQNLQRGMLPRTLPALPAVTASARYLPAGGGGAQVGGDWYDVLPLSSSRVALVIGDVMGHGVSEAVTMGRLRTAVHTLAALELPPDELLARLNDQVSALGDDFYATCLYAVYDPAGGTCTFARAGHPPPAVVHPDGSVRFPDVPLAPLLGTATPPFDTTELTLTEGSLLVLYTDGLIESRTRDIDEGMAHLSRTLSESVARADGERSPERLSRVCDAVTTTMLQGEQTSDDAALLIAQVNRLPPDDMASWPLPSAAIAAGQARKYTREQLGAWHLDDLAMTTQLLVSELISNVVKHAKAPVRLRLVHSDVLVCEVHDGSLTTPHIRRASETDEGGRGLQLVEALSHRWGTRYTATGKCIWTEQLLPAS